MANENTLFSEKTTLKVKKKTYVKDGKTVNSEELVGYVNGGGEKPVTFIISLPLVEGKLKFYSSEKNGAKEEFVYARLTKMYSKPKKGGNVS